MTVISSMLVRKNPREWVISSRLGYFVDAGLKKSAKAIFSIDEMENQRVQKKVKNTRAKTEKQFRTSEVMFIFSAPLSEEKTDKLLNLWLIIANKLISSTSPFVLTPTAFSFPNMIYHNEIDSFWRISFFAGHFRYF